MKRYTVEERLMIGILVVFIVASNIPDIRGNTSVPNSVEIKIRGAYRSRSIGYVDDIMSMLVGRCHAIGSDRNC